MSTAFQQVDFENSSQPPARRLEVRLAEDAGEVRAAQALRYRVFCRELGAQSSPALQRLGLEADAFDAHCDHLLVLDHGREAAEAVVGTYRLMPGARAAAAGGFYSSGEFDLTPMLNQTPDAAGLVEVGRSCVAQGYRTNATVQKLWRGIAQYMADHHVRALFGCASFSTTAAKTLRLPLWYLHQHHLAAPQWRVKPLPGRAVEMSDFDLDAGPASSDQQSIYRSLPPLVKGYLRLGAVVGQGAVIDQQFGTTDVFMSLPVEKIPARYFVHFRG